MSTRSRRLGLAAVLVIALVAGFVVILGSTNATGKHKQRSPWNLEEHDGHGDRFTRMRRNESRRSRQKCLRHPSGE